MAALLPDGVTSAARKQMFIRVVGGDRQRSCLAKRARASCYPGGKVERTADGNPLRCGKIPVGFENPAIAARPQAPSRARWQCRTGDTIEAESVRVPGTLVHRDEVWDTCHADLMRRTVQRLEQEISRLGGDCAHVISESRVFQIGVEAQRSARRVSRYLTRRRVWPWRRPTVVRCDD
jgi:hypothetical protein